MNTKSQLLLTLAVSLASLQGCSAVEQRAEDTQSADKASVEAAATVAVTPPVVNPPVVNPPAETKPVLSTTVDVSKLPVFADRYTVVAGDTLAGIAARQEIYGDARLWPLLYRANIAQIGPRGLIFPNQVLVVGRNHSVDEVKALVAMPKRPKLVAAQPAAKTPAAPTTVVVKSGGDVVAADKPAEIKPATESKPAETTPAASPAVAAVAPAKAPTQSSVKGSQPVKLIDYLHGARRAFEAGDTDWSIYYYTVYLEEQKTNADVWGELGNVYYFDGNLPDAAKAYYNAANILIDRGQTSRAVQLAPAIEEGDPSLSDALYQRLTSVKR